MQSKETRTLYGELGTVDSNTICCFYGFGAASLMPQEGQNMQCTGCGCEKENVDGIVAELKKRQQMRGDRAKMRMAETRDHDYLFARAAPKSRFDYGSPTARTSGRVYHDGSINILHTASVKSMIGPTD